MKPPSKFAIMRINRGYAEYVNRKAELLAKVDCCELDVLRTIRRGQEEVYQDPKRESSARRERAVSGEGLPIPTGPRPITQEPRVPPMEDEMFRPAGFFGLLSLFGLRGKGAS